MTSQPDDTEKDELIAKMAGWSDALVRSSIDLAQLSERAKATLLHQAAERAKASAAEVRETNIKELRRLTQDKIAGMMDELERDILNLRNEYDDTVESISNTYSVQRTALELEYRRLADRLSNQQASYMAKLKDMTIPELHQAIRDFDVEVSKWLLPEESK